MVIELGVAPHAGARIETLPVCKPKSPGAVAPHAGARIETIENCPTNTRRRVAPHAGARIETLKGWAISSLRKVAPHAGARIETLGERVSLLRLRKSLPMRERELKPLAARGKPALRRSLPMRERELKLVDVVFAVPLGGRSPCGSAN